MSEAPKLKQRANTMYDNMEFPAYEHREFPMAIPVVDGKVQPTPYDDRNKAHPVVIVHSQEELDVLKGGGADLVPVNPDAATSALRIETEDDVRAQLYVEAEQAGAKIDKRWSVEKIQRAIAEARDDDTVV